MTDHDRGACLRCGKAATDHRFCGPCRSQLNSLLESVARIEKPISLDVPVAREVALELAMAAGGGHSKHPDPPQTLGAQLHPRSSESEQISSGGGEHAGRGQQAAREFARFEDVLSPAEIDAELEAARRADAAGDPEAATKLGVLLEERGDFDGALAAYRRADRRGDVNGSFNLGCLLAELGELAGAQAALQRADARGDAAAASNLGVLLERQGDGKGALAAYRRADERGDARGAYNLGLLLLARGDVVGGRAAYRRAAERGDPELRDVAMRADAGVALPEAEPPEAEPAVVPEQSESAPAAIDSRAPTWIPALCILALIGLTAFLLVRRRHRSR